MGVHADILFGETGQTLRWLAREGRPSSVTGVQVFHHTVGDDGTEESALSGSASIDSVSTTVSSDSGVSQSNRKTINLTSTSGVTVGRIYRLENATGEQEWVEIREVSSGSHAIARSPLKNDYVSGDTFESTEISASIDSTWVADTGNLSDDTNPSPDYRVRWEYIVDSATYVHDSYFDLVRYSGVHDVTPADMEQFYRGWMDLLPTDHVEDQGQSLIDAGYDDLVLRLHEAGRADEMARDAWVMKQLVMRAAEYQLHLDRVRKGGAITDAYQLAEQRYLTSVDNNVVVSSQTAFAADSSGAGTRVPPAPVWRR